MLSPILSKSTCADCKFCCSFRRTSLWETPVFPAADLPKFQKLNPEARFKPAGKDSFTFDLTGSYKSSDAAEEAPCPFLDPRRGCTLPPDLKPFECKIWPLRAVRIVETVQTGSSGPVTLAVALTPTCPAINKVSPQKINSLVASGLGQQILDYAADHPDIIKDSSDFLSNIIYPPEKI